MGTPTPDDPPAGDAAADATADAVPGATTSERGADADAGADGRRPAEPVRRAAVPQARRNPVQQARRSEAGSASRRRAAALVGGLVVLAALAALGAVVAVGNLGGDSPSDVTSKFFSAVQDGDGEAAQEVLCAKFKSEFTQTGLGDTGMRGFKITDEKKNDGSATVAVRTTQESLGQLQELNWKITLVDEDGFKVCGIEPVGTPGGP